MGPIQSLDDLFSFLQRRFLLIAVLGLCGLMLGIWLAAGRVPVYEATAVLQIETPQVEDDSNPVRSTAAQRIQLIEQRMMVRENLIAVIDRNNLFTDLPAATISDKVAALRKSTFLQSVAGVQGTAFGGGPPVSALIITVQLGDPVQAAAVANDFARTVLDQSSAAELTRAENAAAFFQAEEARIGEEIAVLEAEMTVFTNANLDALPARTELRRDELNSLRTALDDLDRQSAELTGERSTLEAAQPMREVARRRVEEIATQLAILQTQRGALDARRQTIDAAMSRAPEVELGLGTFARRLAQLQEQYSVVTRRLAEAQTDQRLEASAKGERFALLEPAITPERSLGSGGKKLVMLVAIAGVAAGLMLALLLEMLHPVLRTAAQMERMVGLRPLVTVPDLRGRSRRR